MSGSLLPNITYASAGNPLYAAASGGGGGGGNTSSFQQVYTSSFVASTITIAGQSQFNKAVSMSDKLSVTLPITAQSGIFSSTFNFSSGLGTSTLVLATNDSGIYNFSVSGNIGAVNLPGSCASIDYVAGQVLSGNPYTTTKNLATTNGDPVIYGITSTQPLPGQVGNAEFYYTNNGTNTINVSGVITRLGA